MVSQRIRYFLWLTCRQKLLTNLERCKRTLTDDPLCPLCYQAEESTLHALQDCVNFRRIWQQTVPQPLSHTFFSTSIKDWLRLNLCSNILFYNDIPWKLVFASILWQIWKNRNDTVFTESSASVEGVLSRGIAWAKYYYDGWLLPTPGALIASKQNFGLSMLVFNWHETMGSKILQVQTDCKQFWKRAWFVDLIWIQRIGNKAADKLARLANHSSFDVSFLSTPPAAICDVFTADKSTLSL
ncbi:hypothetical protein V6N12_007463 [Hibiscus sabdariffa]|uniref:Reverse transcriptase zinc-binding domain-containing protein n=1 Tax=Hibiscus sabdariffa TaxID=183260 RepID=A0ABR2F1W0_9ROSI